MSCYNLPDIITNYELLSHSDPLIRQNANLFLMGLIYQENAWKITEQMITKCSDQNYQFLGAQILHQKLEQEISVLDKEEIQSLKHFLFYQLTVPTFNMPTIRKITSAAALIAVISCLEDWTDLITDIVKFMKQSGTQLQNGLILLSSLAEELSKSNCIRQGIKIQVKQKILEQEHLLSEIFISTMTINESLTKLALEAIESWVSIGFPLMKYQTIISTLILLIQQQHHVFFQNSCKILSESMKIASQTKFQTLSSIDLTSQMQRYSADQMDSLKAIIVYLRSTKDQLFTAIKTSEGLQNIEIYTALVKQMLLSFGFLLIDDVGFELIQIMVTTLQSKSLKLSFSTFQFWLDFCEKWGKTKLAHVLEDKIWRIVDYLFSVVLQKIKLDNESLLLELIKQQDTVDDMDDVSFNEFRKESQYVIKTIYEFFTKKKEKEGSNLFFGKLIQKIEKDQNYLSTGTELAIYAVKSSIQSMVKEYDTHNLIDFVQYLINKSEHFPIIPPRIAAEIMGIIKDCNREIKSRDSLFLKCLSFSLKYIQDEQLCHYSVYAFQSLMESIQNISSTTLINDLLAFYESKTFTKQTILQKILDGILNSITKLQDRNIILDYFTRIINASLIRNNELLNLPFEPDTHFLPLIEIKTVLDCFQYIKPIDKEYFRMIFLNIANQGVAIVTRIITNYLQKKIKFSNVNQLGLSLAVCKNSLKICENMTTQYLPINNYINLMNIILCIFNPNDLPFFLGYSSLIEIVSKVLNQFMNMNIGALNNWLQVSLPPINNFFLCYAKQRASISEMDPDIIKDWFAIQESILIYDRQIFLRQVQLEQIFNLSLLSLQHLNEKQMQRKVIYFLYLCLLIPHTFNCKYDLIAKSIFYSIPNINNLCYINLARILIILFQGVDLKKKENAFRVLLEDDPYRDVQRDLKEIMAKFMAFAIQSKVERYIKGVLNDLTDIKWKKSGQDLALHLEMRFSNWKREYNRMIKSGECPK